ncbi:hypothetical protein HPB50_003913 [Hyalomma asiaticum]|uniref:Uncharacterized protein n=1 Tax=Hyalomma asiaticum TaxID=266040 RepID=A0ACB7T7S3_HYAAI|nr:hypothetical protein HPB50_003913 [Hyalomma asiaticum]
MTVSLSMNEKVSVLAERLKPDAVNELLLNNCIVANETRLCALIGECVKLRCLRCVACVVTPSQLLRTMMERLPNLEQLELSLVEVVEKDVDIEVTNVRQMASQKRGVIPSHRLRRLYVEVGGDRNFKLLWELLSFFPDLAELHVHLVRGTFLYALSECRRLQDELVQLETFKFTSERSSSVPYNPDEPSQFTKCAAICANVRHKRFGDSWSCVELHRLAFGLDLIGALPSQLAVVVVSGDLMPESFAMTSSQKVWKHVRQLCLLLLPPEPSAVHYPTADADCLHYIREFFSAAPTHIVELNMNSFHFRGELDFMELLPEATLNSLQALSAPPCMFRNQSAVRLLPIVCPNLRDLDVRVDSRGGEFSCTSCKTHPCNKEAAARLQPAAGVAESFAGIARLTLSLVPARLLLWFVGCCGTAVTMRLADWSTTLRFRNLGGLLGDNKAVRCLVLQHVRLNIADEALWECLFRMTSLQHLCLLSSVKLEREVALCVQGITSSLSELQCLHLHYRHDTGESEQRVTWLRRQRGGGDLLLDRPCIGCCSTATFIGLVKPVNRDCSMVL